MGTGGALETGVWPGNPVNFAMHAPTFQQHQGRGRGGSTLQGTAHTWQDVHGPVEWAEGEAPADSDSQGRHDLMPPVTCREQQEQQLQQQ